MKQSAVDAVIRGLKKAGVSIVCYLPDSLFKELYPALDAVRISAPSASPTRARAPLSAAVCFCPAKGPRW
jgi:sulfopyruvate decarboxylase TPP-binding subunit